MKKSIFSVVTATMLFVGCSKDDGPSKKCESCDLSDGRAEICDNGDDTFTAKYGGQTVEITQDQLDVLELTAEEYILLVCATGGGI